MDFDSNSKEIVAFVAKDSDVEHFFPPRCCSGKSSGRKMFASEIEKSENKSFNCSTSGPFCFASKMLLDAAATADDDDDDGDENSSEMKWKERQCTEIAASY